MNKQNFYMSISPKLRNLFHLAEMAAFQEWKDATPERREEITKTLGEAEAKMIIKEIEEESNRLFPCPKE